MSVDCLFVDPMVLVVARLLGFGLLVLPVASGGLVASDSLTPFLGAGGVACGSAFVACVDWLVLSLLGLIASGLSCLDPLLCCESVAWVAECVDGVDRGLA